MSTKQLTSGRTQMLLFLAQRNDWVFVPQLFKVVKPEGITTLHGARKALRELGCVEIENTTPGRPNYRCRLKPTIETIRRIIWSLDGLGSQRKFMESPFCRDWAHTLAHQFNQVLSAYETLNGDGRGEVERTSAQNLRKYGVESSLDLCTKLLTDKEFKDAYDYKQHTSAIMDIFNDPKFNETGKMALNEDEVKRLESSLAHSWLSLKYVVNLLIADPKKQHQLIDNVDRDMRELLPLSNGDIMQFFNLLDILNFNYGFLFGLNPKHRNRL